MLRLSRLKRLVVVDRMLDLRETASVRGVVSIDKTDGACLRPWLICSV
jgi:hypothetical protein